MRVYSDIVYGIIKCKVKFDILVYSQLKYGQKWRILYVNKIY